MYYFSITHIRFLLNSHCFLHRYTCYNRQKTMDIIINNRRTLYVI